MYSENMRLLVSYLLTIDANERKDINFILNEVPFVNEYAQKLLPPDVYE